VKRRLEGGVILANVAKNHSYPIAEAAAHAGYLKKFVTSVYYKPDTLAGRALRVSAHVTGGHEIRRLTGRRAEGIPDALVRTVLLPELAEQVAIRAARALHLDPRPATYLKNEAFDLEVARKHVDGCFIFHGFEQCALFSLKRAKALGAVTVLDQPIMHRAALDRLETEERARLGVPAPAKKPFWFEKHVERKYAEHALTDYVFVGLEFVKRTMVENGFAADRVFVIPYGTDLGSYAPVDRPKRDGFNILYVGPLHYWKGLHYLLDAFQRLELPGATLTIVGKAEPSWEPYFAPRIAALSPRVRHLPGVPHAEMPGIFSAADVLASPSLVGGIGLVCYEAMATGLPVVTSEGDIVIRDGIDGVCVPARDVEGWRAALRGLALNRDRRLAIGRAGAERAKLFSWEAYRRGIVAAYEAIAEREAPRATPRDTAAPS
jgi:glycosyltransferase involved in cell wall biosynthesis